MKILPKTRKLAKTIYIKIDDFREEKVENFNNSVPNILKNRYIVSVF